MLQAGEALLLDGTHELTVDDQGSRGIAVVGVDAEDVHAILGRITTGSGSWWVHRWAVQSLRSMG